MDKLRIDKWLWAARFYKTRALAVEEIDKGRVKVNGIEAKPAREVKAGDTVALEYVSGHPSAARLVGEKSGPARPWRTILMGAGITLGMIVVVAAGIWDFFAGRRRRRRAPA